MIYVEPFRYIFQRSSKFLKNYGKKKLHKIYYVSHFSVYCSAVLSIFTLSCDRSGELFHFAKLKLCPHRTTPEPPSPRPSSVTDHLFLFPCCPRERSKEDTSLTASIALKKSRCTSRARGHSPCPGISSPLAALFPFSCFDRNLAKPENKDMVTCLMYKK